MKLSEAQLAAVKHINGPALCIAGPGSGKTAVIINRAKNLLNMGVKPEELLVVTFAKAAARSMESRFFDMTGITGVRFSTIHSLCWYIIHFGGNSDLTLIPDKIKRSCLLSFYAGKGGSQAANERLFRDICMELSHFKAALDEGDRLNSVLEKELLTGYDAQYVEKNVFEYIYIKYKRFLHDNSYYDFDDMTYLAGKRLETSPELKEKALGFKYIMADEFQDTSISQLYLLKELAADGNLFAVGDDDQSIYSFRGASPEIFNTFKSIFPGLSVFLLKENFRCSRIITSAANSLIKENRQRYPKEIISRYDSDDSETGVILKRCDTTFEELKSISELLNKKNDNKSFAVLTRTNYEAELVCCFLTRMGIHFKNALKNSDPFDHFSVNVILSFLRASQKKAALNDYVNIFKVSELPVPSQAVAACCSEEGVSLFARLSEYAKNDVRLMVSISDMQFKLAMLAEMPPDMQVTFIRNACGVEGYFKEISRSSGTEYEICRERMDGFAEFAKSFSTTESLLNFKRELAATSSGASEPGRRGNDSNVNVMTLHASKGLEFDHVWIINANEGIIPYKKAAQKGMTEEERRLFYVGMTRAREKLTVSCHKSSGGKRSEDSRFLKNIAKNIVW